MELVTIDTLAGQRASLLATEEQRAELFRTRVVEPLMPFWTAFFRMAAPSERGGAAMPDSDDPTGQMARSFGVYHAGLGVPQGLAALDRLAAAGSWQACVEAMRRGWDLLAPERHGIALDRILFTFVLADPSVVTERVGNYTGMGGMPGLVMMMAWPTEYNVPRLPAATVHELNHNVRFTFEPWLPTTTLGSYMIAEGLGEAFAEQMYGEEMVGPWAKALSEEQIVALKARFSDALHITGSEMRSYIFGDWAAAQFQFPALGIPDFAGYTIGYRVLRAYTDRTGKTAAEATFVPWQEIVRESAFFE